MGKRAVDPEEDIEWTAAELAEPSREEMLFCQAEPRVGDLWKPRDAGKPARLVVAFMPLGDWRTKLPRIIYQVVQPDGAKGARVECYLSSFHSWARVNVAMSTRLAARLAARRAR